MNEKKKNATPGFILITILAAGYASFDAKAENEKVTVKEIKSNMVRDYFAKNRKITEGNRLDYLIPETFKRAYLTENGYNLEVFEKVKIFRNEFFNEYALNLKLEVPEQFKALKIITGEQQERIIEEEEAEKLYKEQSDPLYFEKSKNSFQHEFNKRMQQKKIKQ